MVTPLTTLISSMVESGVSVDAATAALSDAFGISPGHDLTHFDPIEAANSNDVDLAGVGAKVTENNDITTL